MEKSTLEYALEYAGKGWPIFPLHTPEPGARCSCGRGNCQNPGKHPRTQNGVKAATTDEATIRRWWGMWPDANIGFAAGGSTKIVILDVDCDHDSGKFGDETLKGLEEQYGSLPETWLCLTGGGGLHYYFSYDGGDIKNDVNFLPGLDVRTTGGYVVVPPSLHASGRRYEWEGAHEPWDSQIAPLPGWLHDLIAHGKARPSGDGNRFEIPQTVTKGGRNRTMFRLAASLRAKGLTKSAILAAVWEENQKRCEPPLERREIETICLSAGRYERGPGLDKLQVAAVTEEKVENAAKGDFESLTNPSVLLAALRLPDPIEREMKLVELRGRAKELKRTRDFDRVLKVHQEALRKEWAQAAQAPEDIDLPDCPLSGLKCFGWSVDVKGVTRVSKEFSEEVQQACSHPVIITERLTNIDTGGERVKLAFYRDKRWKDIIVDKSTIASRQKIIELADAGIQVNSENARHLIQYLHDLEAQNAYRIPRKRCVSRLGWADSVRGGMEFVPYVTDVQYDGDPKYAAFFGAVRPAGDYIRWKERVLEARARSTALRAALASSFASPLMWPMGAQVFFLHLWGGTEVGKTVAQMVAMSVWGNPDLGALLRSYNATYVGMERMAAFCHSLPLALDEQQTVRNNRYFSMDTLIYNLCEGQGKGRGTKSGSIENMATWRLCVLSSGEGPLTDEKSGGGGKNRVIEIYCKDKLFEDAASMADFVKGNYGYAGYEFIKAMSEPTAMEEAKSIRDACRKLFLGIGQGTEKQAASAAMLAVGDYFSSVYVFGLSPDVAIQSTRTFCYALAGYLTDAAEVSQVERAYQWVCDWIAANPGQFERQQPGGIPYHDDRNKLWGKQTEAGYAVIASTLEEALTQAGFIVAACKKGFVERGYFVPGPKDVIKQLRVGGNRPRCYELVMPKLAVGELEEISDEDPDDPWREEQKTILFPGAQG